MPTALAQPRYEPQLEYPVYPDPTESASPDPDNRDVRSAGAARRASARARRRALTHRPFRLSLFGMFAISMLSFQLLLLLWLTGGALYAARRERDIARQINATREDIFRTSERISNFNSMPQIEQLASADGMRRADQTDLDNFTDKSRWTPPATEKTPGMSDSAAPAPPLEARPPVAQKVAAVHKSAAKAAAILVLPARPRIARHPVRGDAATEGDTAPRHRESGDNDSASLPDPADAADDADADSGARTHNKSNDISDRDPAKPARAAR